MTAGPGPSDTRGTGCCFLAVPLRERIYVVLLCSQATKPPRQEHTMTSYTSTTAVRAQDFSDRTTDVNRDRWTVGKLRHVIAALFTDSPEGTPVVITTSRGSGHTIVGATLLATWRGATGPKVKIRTELPNGEHVLTDYSLADIGDTIVPLNGTVGGRGAKWIALDTYRQECSAAIARAQAEHGESEGRGWGSWRAECMEDGVYVTYKPLTGNPAFADQWGTPWHGLVSRAELATVLSDPAAQG